MLGNEGTPGWRCEGAVRVTARDSQAPVLDVLWTDASRRRIRDAMRSSHDPQITIWYGEDLSPEDAVSRREDWREWLLESCGQPSAESRGRVFHGPGVLCGIARAVWSSAESRGHGRARGRGRQEASCERMTAPTTTRHRRHRHRRYPAGARTGRGPPGPRAAGAGAGAGPRPGPGPGPSRGRVGAGPWPRPGPDRCNFVTDVANLRRHVAIL